ncbi:MAG: hypothetical protein K9M17_07385 [Mariprofundaceae bacterium]|nr:hypothetical protein [Mariprofundaceae bacterium]
MIRTLACLLLLTLSTPVQAEEKEYLYYRDVTIPAFQNMREFFNLPNRKGRYHVTLVSDSFGPLTFRIIRAEEDVEQEIKRHRSYSVSEHEFHFPFANPEGKYDLIVEMANSNPAGSAKVSVIVVEQP